MKLETRHVPVLFLHLDNGCWVKYWDFYNWLVESKEGSNWDGHYGSYWINAPIPAMTSKDEGIVLEYLIKRNVLKRVRSGHELAPAEGIESFINELENLDE